MSLLTLSVQYQTRKETVTLPASATGADLCVALQEAFKEPTTLFKCLLKGKKLSNEDILGEVGVKDGAKVMAIGTSSAVAASTAAKKSDPLVKGFEKEDEDLARQKRANEVAHASPWGTEQHTEYRFARFGSLKRFEGQIPHPFAAKQLLNILATDPGIIAVMVSRSFVVGLLEEMDPDDKYAAIQSKERGGCLLGYNQNGGQTIYLRLRLETGAFRPYEELIDTLIHELTHNLVGPHDLMFWRNFGRLKSLYLNTHLSRKGGGVGRALPEFELAKDVRDCEKRVVDKMQYEAQSNGALNQNERSAVAQAAQETSQFMQAIPAQMQPVMVAAPTRSLDEKAELRARMAEAAAKRLKPKEKDK